MKFGGLLLTDFIPQEMLRSTASTLLAATVEQKGAANAGAAACQLCHPRLRPRPRRIHVSATSGGDVQAAQAQGEAGPSSRPPSGRSLPPSYSSRLNRAFRPAAADDDATMLYTTAPRPKPYVDPHLKPYGDPYHLAEKLEELCKSQKLDEALQVLRESRSQAINTAVYAIVFKKALRDRRNKLAWQLWMDVRASTSGADFVADVSLLLQMKRAGCVPTPRTYTSFFAAVQPSSVTPGFLENIKTIYKQWQAYALTLSTPAKASDTLRKLPMGEEHRLNAIPINAYLSLMTRIRPFDVQYVKEIFESMPNKGPTAPTRETHTILIRFIASRIDALAVRGHRPEVHSSVAHDAETPEVEVQTIEAQIAERGKAEGQNGAEAEVHKLKDTDRLKGLLGELSTAWNRAISAHHARRIELDAHAISIGVHAWRSVHFKDKALPIYSLRQSIVNDIARLFALPEIPAEQGVQHQQQPSQTIRTVRADDNSLYFAMALANQFGGKCGKACFDWFEAIRDGQSAKTPASLLNSAHAEVAMRARPDAAEGGAALFALVEGDC